MFRRDDNTSIDQILYKLLGAKLESTYEVDSDAIKEAGSKKIIRDVYSLPTSAGLLIIHRTKISWYIRSGRYVHEREEHSLSTKIPVYLDKVFKDKNTRWKIEEEYKAKALEIPVRDFIIEQREGISIKIDLFNQDGPTFINSYNYTKFVEYRAMKLIKEFVEKEIKEI